jgi:hypothetical protein
MEELCSTRDTIVVPGVIDVIYKRTGKTKKVVVWTM